MKHNDEHKFSIIGFYYSEFSMEIYPFHEANGASSIMFQSITCSHALKYNGEQERRKKVVSYFYYSNP